jgi:hypothetical protein
MKNTNTMFRQGDVLIERIDKIPTTAKKQKRSNSIILAHGEVTGHHHVLETSDSADWWKDGEIAPTLEKPSTLAGAIFVELPLGGAVEHNEHSAIEIPAGTYKITRQREYSPEAIRNVAD